MPRKGGTPPAGQNGEGVQRPPVPPHPPGLQGTSPPPPLIRCLIAELSGLTPFLRKWGPHPAQLRSSPQRWASHCAPPPTRWRPAWARGRAYRTQALLSWKAGPPGFLLPSWVPTGAGTHPPALSVPPGLLWGHYCTGLLWGVPMAWREANGRTSRGTSWSLRDFSQHPRDKLWKLFLEATMAPRGQLEQDTPSGIQAGTLATQRGEVRNVKVLFPGGGI